MLYVVHYWDRKQDKILCSDKIQARHLADALWKVWEQEQKQLALDYGTFDFRAGDLEMYQMDPRFHLIQTKNGTAGILLDSVEIIDPYRNPYLLSLRAKRELLGISLEKMVELTAQPDYKDRELGHRKVTIDEYARYMVILRDYEQDFKEQYTTLK